MIGTAPIFYRISIGNQLAQNLDQVGQSLTIRKFVPPVADQNRYVVEGMVPLENRKLVFKYLEEFRKLVSAGAGWIGDLYVADVLVSADLVTIDTACNQLEAYENHCHR